jgi:orsellinic acid C2-O-methyltransferase
MAEPEPPSGTDPTSTARRLLELVNGSWTTQATYVAASLGIPDLLATGARSGEELARATGAHPPSLHRLLRALVSIGICEELDAGTWALTPMGSLLRADTPDSLRAWTLHWGGTQWSVWGNLLHSVKTGESAREIATGADGFDRLDADPEAAAVFNRAMGELTRLDAAAIVRACDFSQTQRIVDVGGGHGELLAAILLAHPAARGVLFERPHVLENGRRHLESAGVADRCEFRPGDFFQSIPAGGDAYVLKSVIHDWNDERGETILRTCRRAMDAHARLLLVERIVPPRLEVSAAHRAIARGDLNMLVSWGSRERTEAEFRTLLGAAGFDVTAVVPAGPTFGVIDAVPCG